MPNGGGTGDARGDVAHGGIVVVADPDGNQIVRSKADGPVVPQIVAGSSFDSDLLVGEVEY